MFKTFAPVASLLFGIGLLITGNALLGTVLPLRGLAEGFSPISLGLLGSGYNAGFVIGCLAAPHLILRAGHIRAFSTLVALAAAAALLHPMLIKPTVWIATRIITGFCLAGLYIITESWLNDRATNDNRGLIMSVYTVVSLFVTTSGQLMIMLAPIESFNLFALSAVFVSLSLVPVALTTSAQPAPIALVQFRPLRLLRIAPVGLTGTFMIGISNGAFWSLATVYAVNRGLSANGAAIFLSVAVVGGALMQWPIGRLSDRVDRRLVLAALMVLAATTSLALAILPLGVGGLLAMALAFGFVALTSYSVAAAHAYDRADPANYVEMATGVLMANGVGATIGPAVASAGMMAWGNGFLFVHMAIVQLAFFAFILLRWRARPAVDQASKETFEVYSTYSLGGTLTPQPIPADDPQLHTPGGYAAPIRLPQPNPDDGDGEAEDGYDLSG